MTPSGSMFIRQASPEDVQAVLECDAHTQSSASRADLVAAWVAKGKCRIAVEDGQVLGFVVLTHEFFGNGFVSLVVVSPAHQRKGVGLRLLAAAEATCKTPKLFTSTNRSNIASRKLLSKAGFLPSGLIENLDENDPELVYFKFVRQ